MVASGVAVDPECITTFNALKSSKTHRFIVYSIVDSEVIKVVAVGERNGTWADFAQHLKPEEPCFALYDLEWPDGGVTRSKLMFLSWIPDTAKVRAKMLYASSKDALKSKVDGGLVEVQATDASEVAEDVILTKVKAHR